MEPLSSASKALTAELLALLLLLALGTSTTSHLGQLCFLAANPLGLWLARRSQFHWLLPTRNQIFYFAVAAAAADGLPMMS